MKRECRYCEFCKNYGRTDGTYSSNRKSRKLYYCEHPQVRSYTDNTFVGYGDGTLKSPLQLKTCKRWCPAEKEKSNG